VSTDARAPDRPSQWGLAALGAVGLAVAAALAAYAEVHPGDGATLTTLGFSGMLEMKAWLTTAAACLAGVQVLSALVMWGRLPGVAVTPSWITGLHRWSGTAAFLLTLPVVFHCVWSIGFEDEPVRVLVHCVTGCVFYGVFAAKMLALRLRGLPSATVPVLGGLLAAVIVVLWFSSALWFFGQSGDVGY
jgi:hypothetical protein